MLITNLENIFLQCSYMYGTLQYV